MTQQTLLPSVERAHARRRDPWTSHLAASGQSHDHLTETQERVKAVLIGGPYTHEEIIARYREHFGDDVTDSSIRTRCTELVKKELVRVSDRVGTSSRGKPCQMWELVH